jgi:C4-dicarboxylate transporter DctQ subunit
VERTPAELSQPKTAALFRAIQRVEELVVAWGILVIAALTVANVLSRTLLGESLAFAEELSQFCIVLVTFVGLGYAVSQARHIRMTAVYDQLGDRPRKALRVVICASTAALLFLLAWYALRYAETVRALGTVSPTLRVPLFLVYLAAPLGLALGGVQYVFAAWRNLTSPPGEVYLSFEHRDDYEEPAEHL